MEIVIAVVSLILIFILVDRYQASRFLQDCANELLIYIQRMTEPPKSLLEVKLFCEQNGYRYSIDNSIHDSTFIIVFLNIPFRVTFEYDRKTNNNLKNSVTIEGTSPMFSSLFFLKDISNGSMSFSLKPRIFPITSEAIALGKLLESNGVKNLTEQMNRYH